MLNIVIMRNKFATSTEPDFELQFICICVHIFPRRSHAVQVKEGSPFILCHSKIQYLTKRVNSGYHMHSSSSEGLFVFFYFTLFFFP